jgi:hypothetical protein
MKLRSGILKYSIQDSKDDNFNFYNDLVLMDNLAFQHMYFNKSTPNIPCLYQHEITPDNHDDLPLKNRSKDQNNELLKIAILIASNARTKEMSQAIIDSGASCCVTPYLEDFTNQPTSIKNYPKGYSRRYNSTRQRNHTTENKTIKPRNIDTTNRQHYIHTRITINLKPRGVTNHVYNR